MRRKGFEMSLPLYTAAQMVADLHHQNAAMSFPLYTVAQMQEAERRAGSEYGISLAALMQAAGHGLAQAALAMIRTPDGAFPGGGVIVFCGNGNNGGDGYVCAAELLRQGVAVTVCAVGADGLAPGSLARAAADEYLGAGGVITPADEDLQASDIQAGLIIDALLGTGLSRPVGGLYAHLIEVINAAPAPVLACDVPSGVAADSGQIMGLAVQASQTLMMGLAKPACTRQPGSNYFGQATVCDIGLPEALVNSLRPAR